MPSLAQKLDEAESILRANEVINARGEASLLLSLALGRDKTFLVAHPEYNLQPTENDRADILVQRRAAREPFQYIAGETEFYGLDFTITPDVLIPRPETEMVVERAIEILSERSDASFVEVGIGSGCIAISVLHHGPHANAVGLDISPDALSVARRNAERHNVDGRLTLLESDVFSALTGEQYDLIVSNPPYVPTRDLDGLQAEVRGFEPHVALFGGPDGLSIIRRIVDDAPRFLRPSGSLLLEIGFDQSEKVASLFDASVWHPASSFPDLQGIPRLVMSSLR